jgi:hypothetical protein
MKITSVVLVLLSVVAASQVTAFPSSSQGHRIEIRADGVTPGNAVAEIKHEIQQYVDKLDPGSRKALENSLRTFNNMNPEGQEKALEEIRKHIKPE